MTVGELRKALKKYPASAKIAYCAHDQSGMMEDGDLAWGGDIERVGDATEDLAERGYGVILH